MTGLGTYHKTRFLPFCDNMFPQLSPVLLKGPWANSALCPGRKGFHFLHWALLPKSDLNPRVPENSIGRICLASGAWL